jgi:UDP-N-acetylglucosamine 4,6-dehydratase
MTRFWITLDHGVDFVLKGFERMRGGEVYVPKIPSMNIIDLARALAPTCRQELVGIRPGEKLHEVMISADDSPNTLEFEDHFIIQPMFHWWNRDYHAASGGCRVIEGFSYSSDKNPIWLSVDQLRDMVEKLELELDRSV